MGAETFVTDITERIHGRSGEFRRLLAWAGPNQGAKSGSKKAGDRLGHDVGLFEMGDVACIVNPN
jgi:hypothetical protein